MPIGQEKSSGTWWKVLLGVLGGFVLGIGAVAGGVAIAGTAIKTKDLLGPENAQKYLGEQIQDKTIMEIVMDATQGKLKFDTLGDLNDMTPLVGEYVTGIKNSLNDLGCELTNEDMYKWPLATLADNVIGSVKGAKIIRVLSKDNIKYPDPVIKYLSYQTYPEGHSKAGEYVLATDENGDPLLDEDGENVLVDQHLSDMLDDVNYIQRKVDSMRIKMLFTEDDISKSSLLSSIQDKSVKQLSQDGAFDDVALDSVITITDESPRILQTFASKGTTIGEMGDAIDDLLLEDVIEINSESPQILKTFQTKGTKVNEMNTAIDSLKLGEAMELKEGDMLYRCRDTAVKDLNNIDSILTIDDIMPDRSEMKFIKYVPGDTTINNIGTAVNDIPLTKAFEENIYSGTGDTLNSTWKYMLIEKDEAWIADNPGKNPDPFATYKCSNYTVGGNGTGSDPDKGINGLIQNMSDNMQRVSLNQLDADGIVELDDGFLTKSFTTGAWAAVPHPAGKTTFGELTLLELTTMVTSVS